MENLEVYILRIPDFDQKPASALIDYFAFYLQQVCNCSSFSAAQVKECFESLSITPYSNISSYLSKNSGRNGKYIKQKTGYILSRTCREKVASEVSEVIERPPSDELIDLSILSGTPYYINQTAKEMIRCYDSGFYNATLVLMRKLIETLIIECFERFGIDQVIKDPNGVFLYLSDLIPKYLESDKWNPSRNIGNSLKAVKKYGDLSAHNRRFMAKRSDIDSFKFELRQALQEIVLTIDYGNWRRDI